MMTSFEFYAPVATSFEAAIEQLGRSYPAMFPPAAIGLACDVATSYGGDAFIDAIEVPHACHGAASCSGAAQISGVEPFQSDAPELAKSMGAAPIVGPSPAAAKPACANATFLRICVEFIVMSARSTAKPRVYISLAWVSAKSATALRLDLAAASQEALANARLGGARAQADFAQKEAITLANL